MSGWNAMSYDGKDNLLRVVREQAELLFAMAEAPEAWDAPTACVGWSVRDVVGHLVDTTEAYFVSLTRPVARDRPPTRSGCASWPRG